MWHEEGQGAKPTQPGKYISQAVLLTQDKPDWGSAGGDTLLFVEAICTLEVRVAAISA